MRHSSFVFLLLCGFRGAACCAGQQPAQQPAPAPLTSSAAHTVIVPRGTVVLLTLVSPIKSVSTGVGGTVRAVVAFPITDKTQLAIPAGTYVEGQVLTLAATDKKTGQPAATMHFTSLLYANGYTVALDAVNSAALLLPPALIAPEPSWPVPLSAEYAAFHPDGRPHSGPGAEDFEDATLPTPEMNLSLFHHKKKPPPDVVLFPANFQFQMTVDADLVLDTTQVDAAAAVRPH